MRLWTFQPPLAATLLRDGATWRCRPEMSSFWELDDFRRSYLWLVEEMEKRIPKPRTVRLPIWAWYINHGKNQKPDRRRKSFNREGDNVLLQLEIPKEEVLLSSFDSWHAVLNNVPLISEEEWEKDFEKASLKSDAMGESEKLQTWKTIFSPAPEEDFVQACFWEIRPEYLMKIYQK